LEFISTKIQEGEKKQEAIENNFNLTEFQSTFFETIQVKTKEI